MQQSNPLTTVPKSTIMSSDTKQESLKENDLMTDENLAAAQLLMRVANRLEARNVDPMLVLALRRRARILLCT